MAGYPAERVCNANCSQQGRNTDKIGEMPCFNGTGLEKSEQVKGIISISYFSATEQSTWPAV